MYKQRVYCFLTIGGEFQGSLPSWGDVARRCHVVQYPLSATELLVLKSQHKLMAYDHILFAK